jgi:hypothetical protein
MLRGLELVLTTANDSYTDSHDEVESSLFEFYCENLKNRRKKRQEDLSFSGASKCKSKSLLRCHAEACISGVKSGPDDRGKVQPLFRLRELGFGPLLSIRSDFACRLGYYSRRLV